MQLFEQATDEQIADADDLVDPTLRRSTADWAELELPPRMLDLVTRAYDTYGRLVGVPAEQQGEHPRRARRPAGRAHGVLRRVLRRRPHPHGRDRPARRSARPYAGCARRCGRCRRLGRSPGHAREEGEGEAAGGARDAAPRVAVLLAGGVGTRVGLDIPKQLIKIAGKTILEHTLAAFQAHPMVDEIIVMMAPGPPRRRPRDGPHGRLRQGDRRPRGRRHPQRHDARRRWRRSADDVAGALPRRRPAAGQRRGSSPSASRPSSTTTRSTSRSPRPTRSSRSSADNTIRAIPPRADLRRGQTPQALPGLGAPDGVRRSPARTPTSPRPTTAASCCATSPTCRSGWSRARSAT